MTQTAVEWLGNEIDNELKVIDNLYGKEIIGRKIAFAFVKRILIKAKEMEKEQNYTYDEIRTIAYNAYCLGQLSGATEGKYNLWIQHYKKKTQAKSYQDKMKKKVKQARANAKLIK